MPFARKVLAGVEFEATIVILLLWTGLDLFKHHDCLLPCFKDLQYCLGGTRTSYGTTKPSRTTTLLQER